MKERYWFKWCVDDTYDNIDAEKILQLIQKEILDSNKEKQIFNQDVLEAAIQEKNNRFMISGRKQIKKKIDICLCS